MNDNLCSRCFNLFQRFFEWMSNKGQEKVLNFFLRVLDAKYETEKCTHKERFQESLSSSENLEEYIECEILKFRRWLHHLISSGLLKAKDRLQVFGEIAKEVR